MLITYVDAHIPAPVFISFPSSKVLSIYKFSIRFDRFVKSVFEITRDEYHFLRSQIVTLENDIPVDGRGKLSIHSFNRCRLRLLPRILRVRRCWNFE
jgi:hypothetical protein